MSSCVKFLRLGSQIFVFRRLISNNNVYNSKIKISNLHERLLSTKPIIAENKFTKLSSDLINEHAATISEKSYEKKIPRNKYIKETHIHENNYAFLNENNLDNNTNGRYVGQQDGKGSLANGLKNLEYSLHKWGRIEAYQIQQLLDIKIDKLSCKEAAMLLRSCGSFIVASTPQQRQQISNRIWNLILEKDCEMTTQIFNSRMLTMLENNEKFNPSQILNDMEIGHSLTPSQASYELLIAGFCEQGDIVGASKIMEHMKSLELPINHFVLHYFIKAHVKNNDIEGAKNIMKKMNTFGLKLTQETYHMYLIGLVETGNMNTFQQGLSEMYASKLELRPKSIYDLAIASAKYQSTTQTQQILKLLKFNEIENTNEAYNTILQLSVLGDFGNSVKLLNSLEINPDSKSKLAARLLICNINNRMEVAKLFELYDLLKLNGFNDIHPDLLIYWATITEDNKCGYGLSLIDYLKSKDEKIEVRSFIPLLKASIASKNPQQIYEIVKEMCSNCRSTEDPVHRILANKVIPALINLNQSIDQILIELKNLGVKKVVRDCLLVSYHLKKSEYAAAAKLVFDGITFSPFLSRIEIAEAFFTDQSNNTQLAHFLRAVDNRLDNERSNNFFSWLLLKILNHPNINTQMANKIVDAYLQSNISVSERHLDNLQMAYTKLQPDDQLNQKIISLTKITPIQRDKKPKQDLMKLSIAELETKLKENPNSFEIRNVLFSKYLDDGNFIRAEALKDELVSSGNIMPLVKIGCMYAFHNQDLQKAKHYLDLLCREYPEMLRYSSLLIDISTLYLLNSDYSKAMDLLMEHGPKLKAQLEQDGYTSNLFLLNKCKRLLRASTGQNPFRSRQTLDGKIPSLIDLSISDKSLSLSDLPLTGKSDGIDIWKTFDLMELLFDNGFIQKGAVPLLQFTTDLFIKNANTDDLLTFYERCVSRYEMAPLYGRVLAHISDKSTDKSKLQKGIELTKSVADENGVLMTLLLNSISQKNHEEAINILKTINSNKCDFKILKTKCSKFNEDDLLFLEEITRGSFLHKEAIFQLIKYYGKMKDADKVKLTFDKFQSNGLEPIPSMLNYINKLNIDQPQKITNQLTKSIDENKRNNSSDSVQQEVEKIETNLHADHTEEKNIKKNNEVAVMEAVSKVLSLEEDGKRSEANKLLLATAKQLINARDYRDFRRLVYEIAETKNLNLLNELRVLKISDNFANRFFNKKLFATFIHNGRGEEIVDYLDKNRDKLNTFVSLQVLQLLYAQQDKREFNKLEELILRDGDTRTNFPLVLLYQLYTQHQPDKAQQLTKENPFLKRRLEIRDSRQNKKSTSKSPQQEEQQPQQHSDDLH